ncbi:hypothetical protein [Tumebacillus flagellatus]|uniref:Uncharacterized protein n=1 Tax=Tumebacillus flagellatus TaxID=1157490 RepID=A0A074LKI5_9BACL|nr:hypothetical protein [Tumebacillus flagellatus]KEO82626.1 hypothetical protein EL26_14675 [Tumebacillus flagellatus]
MAELQLMERQGNGLGQAEDVRVVQVAEDALGTYWRTDGLGRLLHPEIAAAGMDGEEAGAFLLEIASRVHGGEWLDVLGGRLFAGGAWYRYAWQPEQFVFWMEQECRPAW